MASRDYTCLLRFNRRSWGEPKWRVVGNRITVSIDLASTSSKVEALLQAIHESGRGPHQVEQYELMVEDENGVVFRALSATREQVQLHRAGYPVNVEYDSLPQALADFTDDQLLDELRRRLSTPLSELPDPDAG